MASGRRSATGRPRRRTRRARSSRRRSPTSSATRSRRRTHGRTCSSGGGASWTIGKPASRRAPEGAGAHRADRTTPCRAGVGHAPHRVDRARGPGGSRANRFRTPAGGRVGIEHEPCYHCAGTTPAPLDAILVDGDRDALHRDRVVVPRRPSSPCSRRARLRGWLARTVVPSAPGAGWTAPAPNAGSAGGADAAPGRTWKCGPASIPRP